MRNLNRVAFFIVALCFLLLFFFLLLSKQHFFGLIPVAVASDWENFPADCRARAESSSFLGLENIFMPLLQFSSPNTFFFICFRKVDANSSSLSCILHLGFFEFTVWKVKCEQLPGSYLNSSQMPGPWCKFLHGLFSQAHAPNLETYTETQADGYRSLKQFWGQLCNEF